MKKIIVTGGAGYIGSHTAIELIEHGYEPVIIDNLSNSHISVIDGIEKISGKKIPFYEADCNDIGALREIFEKEQVSGVIHFAAFKAVGESVEKPLLYFQNNVGSMIRILEVMSEMKVNHLVFSSSCTVYGQPDHNPVTENSKELPAQSPYGYTKQVCERVIKEHISSQNELGAVLLRYFNPIGAHPSGLIGELPIGIPNNLVPYITQTAAGVREELLVFGNDYNTPDGTPIRDYIHVQDLAKAHIKAFEWLVKNNGRCEAFNVGTGKGISVLKVIQAFEKVSGQKLNYRITERRTGDVEQIWASPDMAEKELDWKALRSLEDALTDAWRWQENLSEFSF